MAEVPNAELDWRWHWWQWQIYSARGFAVGVLKLTAPHWQLASMLVVMPKQNDVTLGRGKIKKIKKGKESKEQDGCFS